MQSDDTCTMGKRNEHHQRNTTEHDIRRSNNNDQETRGGIEMKEGLMWFIVAVVLGTIIPSKGWLAVFGIGVFIFGWIMCALYDRANGKK